MWYSDTLSEEVPTTIIIIIIIIIAVIVITIIVIIIIFTFIHNSKRFFWVKFTYYYINRLFTLYSKESWTPRAS